ncbi:MAG: SRPBCC domain-containing protein [Proteobacteria bacterium]|nr:SRPBCC domain-containing protein [Pseudomonadota bacterium]
MTTEATRTLVIEKEMAHPPQKIWRALTQGALIKEWLMDNDFQPVVGHKFNFRSTPNPHWDGIIQSEVLEVEPDKRLSYTWNSLGLVTVVVFTLTATGTGTLLRMEQSGFRADQNDNYQGANYGWRKFVSLLEKVVGGLPI